MATQRQTLIMKIKADNLSWRAFTLILIITSWLPLATSAQSGNATTPSAPNGAVFKVGVGKRDITPQEAVPMWGYGARHDLLSQGTLDPLYAVALVIQAGDQKVAIVGLDLGR